MRPHRPSIFRRILQPSLNTLGDGRSRTDSLAVPVQHKNRADPPRELLKRVIKPAAIRACIAVTADAKRNKKTALNYQTLRRASSTLFGARAKDPKSTQAHMRHADPVVTLRHYQQAIPAEVNAAAIALEADLLAQQEKREERAKSELANMRPV